MQLIDSVLLGRRAQLAELRRGWAAAQAGQGGFWLLLGEPGIGKTRLAEELAAVASVEGAAVAWGRCWEGGGAPPFLPWTQAFAALGRPEVFAARPDTGGDPDAARFALFTTAADALRDAAEGAPVLVLLDDLHEADHASLLMLRFLADSVRSMPVLLLGTWRDTVAPDADTSRAARALHLDGLDVADIEQLAPDIEAARRLHEKSGGNPLFLRAIVESGATDVVPATVREAIRMRAAVLSAPAVEALHAGAVLGRDVPADVLAAVLGWALPETLEVLAAAEREHLVRSLDGRTFRFAHGLVRETLYGMLGPARRIELHGRAAVALAAVPGVEPSLVAHHAFRAGDSAAAVTYARQAAASAARRLAFEEAAAQGERAVQALALSPERDDALRCDVLTELAEAKVRTGDLAAARAAYVEALHAAEGAGDGERYGRAALGHAGPPEAAEFGLELAQPLRRALELLPAEDSPLRARLQARLSDILLNTGRSDAGRPMSDSALAMARRSGDPEVLAFVLRCRFYNVWEPDLDARLADTAELIDAGLPDLEVVARTWRAAVHLTRGDVAAFDQELGLAARLADALREPYLTWLVAVSSATRAALDGRFAESERLATEALQNGPGVRAVVDGFGVQLVFLRYLTGGFAELEPILRASVEEFPTSPVRRAGLAWLLAESDRHEEAAAEFERLAAADFTDIPTDFVHLLSMQILGLLCVALGDRTRAARLYELLLPYAGWNVVAGVSSGFLGSVSLVLGGLARVTGRSEDAERHLADAERRHRAMGARPWVALTRYQLALLRGDDTLRREVAVAAQDLGMRRLAEQAAVPPASDDAPAECVFRREGHFWTVSYGGRLVRVRDVKGVRDIAALLARPGQEVHVLELAGGGAAAMGLSSGSDPVLDDRARAELRARIGELEAEIEQAQSWADDGRAERAREELDDLLRETAAALGLGGRSRSHDNPAERARKAVKARIDDALGRIESEHAGLAQHLRRSIRTGLFCVYTPVEPVAWRL